MTNKLKLARREFLKICAGTAGYSLISSDITLAASRALTAKGRLIPARSAAGKPISDVYPMIGTGWRGHMFPGAVAPFGLVQLSPDTSGPPEPKWNARGDYYDWEHCSGYHYPDDVISGFSHTHVQGTGGKDLGDILLMPLVEGKNWSWDAGIPSPQAEMQIEALGMHSGWVYGQNDSGYRSYFSHQQEIAKAGYYSVFLDTPKVQAELTSTTRCGMHRYGYATSAIDKGKGMIVDLVHSLNCKVYHAELNVESSSCISGMRSTHGWARDRQIYFVLEFSSPADSIEVNVNSEVSSASIGKEYAGERLKAICKFSAAMRSIMARVGISCTSIDGARKNLKREISHWDFDAVAKTTEQAWSEALAMLEADIPDRKLRQTFYTGTYHSLVAPATFNDVDGTYRGQDHKNHPNPGFTKYTALSIWDIYRGEFPFLTLVQPGRVNDIIRTLLADYRELDMHALPMWPLWGNETWSMNGFHAVGMILGAYVRGFRDFDIERAYKAIYDTALTGTDVKRNRQMQDRFREQGFVPIDFHNGAVSCTLDLAYDYWCAGAMAELLGKQEDATMFYKLGQNYRNLFDPSTGFMRGRLGNGKWREPFRPDEEYEEDYVEADAWQASFSVPHDIQGMIALHGGDAPFIAKLDELFTAPSDVLNVRPDVTGMVGQNAQGNEPSHCHPYLFAFAGAPWKTQYWVRKVASLYNNTPAGIPGNDDCGQLSSWLVFAALGFYPVNAATGVYILGSPMVNRVTIHNALAKTKFTIVTENNSEENVYVERVQLNGRDLNCSWITHAQIIAGGELRFRMSRRPNKDWASAPEGRPPSGLIKS